MITSEQNYIEYLDTQIKLKKLERKSCKNPDTRYLIKNQIWVLESAREKYLELFGYLVNTEISTQEAANKVQNKLSLQSKIAGIRDSSSHKNKKTENRKIINSLKTQIQQNLGYVASVAFVTFVIFLILTGNLNTVISISKDFFGFYEKLFLSLLTFAVILVLIVITLDFLKKIFRKTKTRNLAISGIFISLLCIFIWNSDPFQKEFFPTNYWLKQISIYENKILADKYKINEISMKLEKLYNTVDLQLTHNIKYSKITGLSLEEITDITKNDN